MNITNTKGSSICCKAEVRLLRVGSKQWYCCDCGQPCKTKIVLSVVKKDVKPSPWITYKYPEGPFWTGD